MGLGAGGSERELAKRISDHLAATATATATAIAEPNDAEHCDCVVEAQVEYDNEDEMRPEAAATLQAKVEGEPSAEMSTDGSVAMGNRRGLNFVEPMSRISAHDDRIAALDKRFAAQDSRIASLEQRVQCLSKSLPQYKRVRSRFIATYKRDVLKDADDADRDIIRNGNMWAHGGDAIMDAQLYDGLGGRRDSSVYKKLYGLDPRWVLEISEFVSAHQS